MPQVTTPDGQVIFVPDQFPGLPAPPPVDFGGGIAPVAPAPVPSVVDQLPPEVLANLGIGTPPPPPVVPFEQATPPPVQNAPDFQAPSQATFGAQNVRQNRAFEQGQARQRAYEASPEGRIEGAAQGAQGQLEQQAQTAEGLGDVASREAEESRALLEDRNVNLQRERQASESQERERAQGIADRRVSYEKAIDAEANYKVDEGRRWSNAGTGRKVLAGISVALSGLGDALQFKSGPNMAIQIIQDAIKDDVAAQIREREQLGRVADRRRNSIDTYRQETGDLRDAANLKVAEEYKRTADQIEAAAAKYASPKAQAAAMNNASALRVQSQQLMGQAAEGAFNRDLQRQGVALQRAGIGVQYAKLKEEQRQFDKGMELNEKKLLLDAANLDQSGNAAGAKALREQAGKDRALGGSAPPTVLKDSAGNIVTDDKGTPQLSSGMMTQKDGVTTWNAPSEKEAIDLRSKRDKAERVISLLDDVRAIRERVGGESGAINSDDYQKMQTIKANLVALQKSGMEGMSSDTDLARIESMLGVKDIDSFRAQAAKLDEARSIVVDNINSAYKHIGLYDGPKLEFEDPLKFKKAFDPEEANTKALISKPQISITEAREQAQQIVRQLPEFRNVTQESGFDRDLIKRYSAKAKEVAAEYKGIAPWQKQRIGDLADTARSAPDENVRRTARLTLTTAATQGQTPEIRAAAQRALVQAGETATEQVGRRTGVAYETVPKAPTQ